MLYFIKVQESTEYKPRSTVAETSFVFSTKSEKICYILLKYKKVQNTNHDQL